MPKHPKRPYITRKRCQNGLKRCQISRNRCHNRRKRCQNSGTQCHNRQKKMPQQLKTLPAKQKKTTPKQPKTRGSYFQTPYKFVLILMHLHKKVIFKKWRFILALTSYALYNFALLQPLMHEVCTLNIIDCGPLGPRILPPQGFYATMILDRLSSEVSKSTCYN